MLELVLKEKWFRMIETGEKKEEYRDLKPYWWVRIFTSPYHLNRDLSTLPEGGYNGKHRQVRFRLGYRKDAPEMIWNLGHPRVGYAKPEWSDGIKWKVIVLPLLERKK